MNKLNETRRVLQKDLDKIEQGDEQKTHGLRPADYKVQCGKCDRKIRKAFTIINVKKNHFTCLQCFLDEINNK